MSVGNIRYPTAANDLQKLNWHNSKIRVEFIGSCLKQDEVTYTPSNRAYLFIFYELGTWSQDLKADFTLKDCFFGVVKLTKNVDLDKYSFSRYAFASNFCSLFSYLGFDWGNNVAIFGLGNSSSAHIVNEKKDILVFGEGPTQELDDTTVKAKYSVNFLKLHRIEFYLLMLQKYINSKQKFPK